MVQATSTSKKQFKQENWLTNLYNRIKNKKHLSTTQTNDIAQTPDNVGHVQNGSGVNVFKRCQLNDLMNIFKDLFIILLWLDFNRIMPYQNKAIKKWTYSAIIWLKEIENNQSKKKKTKKQTGAYRTRQWQNFHQMQWLIDFVNLCFTPPTALFVISRMILPEFLENRNWKSVGKLTILVS